MIKLIIFDVGGVIDTFDESLYIKYICKKRGLDPLKFRRALAPLLDRMEISELELYEMKKILAQKFKVSEDQLEWESAFIKLNTVNRDVVKLITRLSKKYKIAILTNVSRSRHLMKMELYLEKVKYDKMFTSCYLKMRKPDAEIYQYVLEKMKAKPKEAVFIDNMEKNVVGARKVGITAIRFTDYKSLVKNLRALGID